MISFLKNRLLFDNDDQGGGEKPIYLGVSDEVFEDFKKKRREQRLSPEEIKLWLEVQKELYELDKLADLPPEEIGKSNGSTIFEDDDMELDEDRAPPISNPSDYALISDIFNNTSSKNELRASKNQVISEENESKLAGYPKMQAQKDYENLTNRNLEQTSGNSDNNGLGKQESFNPYERLPDNAFKGESNTHAQAKPEQPKFATPNQQGARRRTDTMIESDNELSKRLANKDKFESRAQTLKAQISAEGHQFNPLSPAPNNKLVERTSHVDALAASGTQRGKGISSGSDSKVITAQKKEGFLSSIKSKFTSGKKSHADNIKERKMDSKGFYKG